MLIHRESSEGVVIAVGSILQDGSPIVQQILFFEVDRQVSMPRGRFMPNNV